VNVQGYPVPPAVEAACLARMRTSFTHADIVDAAIAQGVFEISSEPIAYPLADALLEREKEAGRIVRDRDGWRPA
jgi:hypothetical protein